MYQKDHRKNEKGQTLLLGVLALLLLFFAAFFLFDLQNIIRGKMKTQTGVDAAALAGAHWQRNTLNMIGDLNLIKASTLLISDIPPFPPSVLTTENDIENLRLGVNVLTEIQTRVSFVGPLVGVGAAQQAAKVNGINYNKEYAIVAKDHLQRVRNDDIYGPEKISSLINNYSWREPYIDMLSAIYGNGKGFAVAPNVEFYGTPSLKSNTNFIGYLQTKSIYDAILADYWCPLRELLRMNYDVNAARWWGDIELVPSHNFSGESEFLSLGISYFTGSSPYNMAQSFIQNAHDDKKMTGLREQYDQYDPENQYDLDNSYDPLPHITWAMFDNSKWSSYDETLMNEWERYLRSPIAEQFQYYGCNALMSAEMTPVSASGYWGAPNNVGSTTIGKVFNNGRLSTAETRLRSGMETISTSALAKPLGSLTSNSEVFQPHMAGRMILPCFDQVALIPVALESGSYYDPFDYIWYAFVTEYLPALGQCDEITDMGPDKLPNPTHWAWFTKYHRALQKLNDPNWRERGINWLETVITKDSDGNTIKTNEDTCDDWWDSGGSGTRQGPSIIR